MHLMINKQGVDHSKCGLATKSCCDLCNCAKHGMLCSKQSWEAIPGGRCKQPPAFTSDTDPNKKAVGYPFQPFATPAPFGQPQRQYPKVDVMMSHVINDLL